MKYNASAAALVVMAILSSGASGSSARVELLEQRKLQFNMPAQRYADSFRDFRTLTGVSVVYGQGIENLIAPEVRGALTPLDALARLFSGSQFTYEVTGASTVSVRLRTDVEIEQQPKPAPEPAPESRSLRPETQGRLESITVTGTHIRGGAPQSGSPVYTVTETDIRHSGTTSVSQLLGSLPQSFGRPDGLDASSVLSPNPGSPLTNPACVQNLRNLGPEATLVLADGRPRPRVSPGDSAYTDLCMIPLEAVAGIEILADGASAIYGSDAVAGVTNLILKRRLEGALTKVRYSFETDRDGGAVEEITQRFGKTWTRGDAWVIYEHRAEDDVDASSRPATADFWKRGYRSATLSPLQDSHVMYARLEQKFARENELLIDLSYGKRHVTSSYTTAFGQLLGVETLNQVEQRAAGGGATFTLTDNWKFYVDAGVDSSTVSSELTRNFSVPIGAVVTNDSVSYGSQRLEFHAQRNVADMAGGKAQLAVGVGGYREAYERDVPHIDAQTFSRSVFAELITPIGARATDSSDHSLITVRLAARYEDSSSFGHAFLPKLGVQWMPRDYLRFRTTFGTSIRAPSLSQIAPAGASIAVLDLPDPAAPGGTTRTASELGTNPGLRTETATIWTGGIDFALDSPYVPKIMLTWFDIMYRNRILAFGGAASSALHDPELQGRRFRRADRPENFDALMLARLTSVAPGVVVAGCRASDYISGPCMENPANIDAWTDLSLSNVAETFTNGFDLKLNKELPLSNGTLELGLMVTYVLNFESRRTQFSENIELANSTFNILRLRARTHVGFTSGPWSVHTFANFANRYTNTEVTPNVPVASMFTMDLSVIREMPQGFGMRFDVGNLTNRGSPRVVNRSDNGVTYDVRNGDPSGRTLSFWLWRSW